MPGRPPTSAAGVVSPLAVMGWAAAGQAGEEREAAGKGVMGWAAAGKGVMGWAAAGKGVMGWVAAGRAGKEQEAAGRAAEGWVAEGQAGKERVAAGKAAMGWAVREISLAAAAAEKAREGTGKAGAVEGVRAWVAQGCTAAGSGRASGPLAQKERQQLKLLPMV